MATFERTPKLTTTPHGQKSLHELKSLRVRWRQTLTEAWRLGAMENTKLLNRTPYRIMRLVGKKTQIGLGELQFIGLDENLELYDVTATYRFDGQTVRVQVKPKKADAERARVSRTDGMKLVHEELKGGA
jgi:hypothetical protein